MKQDAQCFVVGVPISGLNFPCGIKMVAFNFLNLFLYEARDQTQIPRNVKQTLYH